MRSPLFVRPAARMSALARFHSRGAEDINLPAAARSLLATNNLPVVQELQSLLGHNFDPLPQWVQKPERLHHADPTHRQQSWWSAALGKKAMTKLLDATSPRDQCRLLEQSTGIGHAFMAVPPVASLGHTIPTHKYRLALKWWLGLPILTEPGLPSCPGCQAPLDQWGDHLLCCPRNNFPSGTMQCRRHWQPSLARVARAAQRRYRSKTVRIDSSERRTYACGHGHAARTRHWMSP